MNHSKKYFKIAGTLHYYIFPLYNCTDSKLHIFPSLRKYRVYGQVLKANTQESQWRNGENITIKKYIQSGKNSNSDCVKQATLPDERNKHNT